MGNECTSTVTSLDEALSLQGCRSRVVSVLLLRGAQTVAELRTRTERYVGGKSDESDVEAALHRLSEREPPFVKQLTRRARRTRSSLDPPPRRRGGDRRRAGGRASPADESNAARETERRTLPIACRRSKRASTKSPPVSTRSPRGSTRSCPTSVRAEPDRTGLSGPSERGAKRQKTYPIELATVVASAVSPE